MSSVSKKTNPFINEFHGPEQLSDKMKLSFYDKSLVESITPFSDDCVLLKNETGNAAIFRSEFFEHVTEKNATLYLSNFSVNENRLLFGKTEDTWIVIAPVDYKTAMSYI